MTTTRPFNPILAKIHAHRGMIFPLACIGLLLVLLVPLPTAALDLLLALNLTLSAIVLLTTIYVRSPLEFAAFPSILLAITLFRLVLNVATTRLILSGSGNEYAAGDVVHAFSDFVTSGSLAVGFILFAIIFVIQFVVITKGGSRISEVAARFRLDALPGKQMAIDADMNAGAITEQEARQRREIVAHEADFYGAMDGASKFVRGDAIAAAIIVVVNILGGLYVGMFEHNMLLSDCLRVYTKLTIGDGLVSQIPAFIVSLGAGLIVTRSAAKSDLGDDIARQLFARPRTLVIAVIFLALLAIAGLPKLPLLVLAACCGGLAWVLNKREADASAAEAGAAPDPPAVEKLLEVDAMELELGHGLIRLADAERGGDLMERVAAIRRHIALELGIIVPPVRIHDQQTLAVNDYAIRIKGQLVARGVTYPDQFLAIDRGDASGVILGGEETCDPATGAAAYWITEPQCPSAQRLGYVICDAATILSDHLTEVIGSHAHELLTRQAVKSLLDHLRSRAAALVDEVVPAQIKPGELQRVLQSLLRERVPIRDLETILETLGERASQTNQIDLLTEHVRHALCRAICRQHLHDDEQLHCLTLDPSLEELIARHAEHGAEPLPPAKSREIAHLIEQTISQVAPLGRPPVLLCAAHVRAALRRIIEPYLPRVAVLSFTEIAEDVSVQAMGLAGGGVNDRPGKDAAAEGYIEDGYESANV